MLFFHSILVNFHLLIFIILLNQFNTSSLWHFHQFLQKYHFQVLNSSTCYKTWFLSTSSRFPSKLGPIWLTSNVISSLVKYRAHKYNLLSMNFLVSKFTVYVTTIHYNGGKNLNCKHIFYLGHKIKFSLPHWIL